MRDRTPESHRVASGVDQAGWGWRESDKPPLVRQESLGEEEARAETFHRNPAGSQPRPAELASGRKRVLRGAGATRAAKRRQRVSGPCDGAPKCYSVAGADVVKGTEGRVA